MAYDEELAHRIREVVQGEAGISEKRMFGGLAFLVDGMIAVSASSKGGLLLRVDPADGDVLLDPPDVAPFQMRGRDMSGWLRVAGKAIEGDDDLRRWVTRGIACARSLPAKQPRRRP